MIVDTEKNQRKVAFFLVDKTNLSDQYDIFTYFNDKLFKIGKLRLIEDYSNDLTNKWKDFIDYPFQLPFIRNTGDNVIFVETLFIDEEFQNKGYGTSVIKLLKKQCHGRLLLFDTTDFSKGLIAIAQQKQLDLKQTDLITELQVQNFHDSFYYKCGMRCTINGKTNLLWYYDGKN